MTFHERTKTIGYLEACMIAGQDIVDTAIANGDLKPVRMSGEPGAPNLFLKEQVERLRDEGRFGLPVFGNTNYIIILGR
jgi:hypothetical protein